MKDKTQTRSQVVHLIEDMRDKPFCAVRRPTDQEIANTSDVAVDFTNAATIEEDTHGMFSASSPAQLTVVTPGVYLLDGYIQWEGDGDGARLLRITVDSNIVAATRTAVIDTPFYQQVSTVIRLTAGQVVALTVRHSAGAALDLTASNNAPRLSAIWMRP